ncbi:hypothetical protein Q1695_003901 [Nippostrongylus brasiliensis]|nr:hypothetical protein Q1695_003901 [Nippostrongylus brasiliensis]
MKVLVNSFFLEVHRALWPQIEQVLKNDAFKDYGVVFTGHSLGGAIAAMSAVKAVKLGLLSTEQVTIYTYGEPRVGDYTFAKNFDELVRNSYRVVNRFDSVVHLGSCVSTNNPMYDLSTHVRCRTEVNNTYYHHGTEIWYPEGMAPGSAKMECVGEPRGEDEKCSNSEDLMQNAEYMYHDHLFYFSKQTFAVIF